MQPFKVSWDLGALERLRRRLRAFPFPDQPSGEGWRYGCDPVFLREACRYWADAYDADAAARDLNRYPQFTADVEDHSLHFAHIVGEAEGRRPLLLIHGWPASYAEFWPAVEALAFPSRSGGSPVDAFDLVIPSLPGFGFSSKPDAPLGPKAVGRLLTALMRDTLGYKRFLLHGTDWGATIAPWMALHAPDALAGIHVDYLGAQPGGDPQTPEEGEFKTANEEHEKRLGAYSLLQGTRVQSLAFAMSDNPVAQASWIWERFHDWADRRGRAVEDIFGWDTLVTTAMLYTLTDRFATAAWIYTGAQDEGARTLPEGARITVPTGFARWPDPRHPPVPRSLLERAFNLVHCNEQPEGGHFPPWEATDAFVADLRLWGAKCPVA